MNFQTTHDPATTGVKLSALGTGSLVFNGGNLSSFASRTLGNDMSLTSNATVTVRPSQTLILNGIISGSSTLTKTGTGTLTLAGPNT